MQKSDIIRLRHMFDAAKEAVSFIQKEERASLLLQYRLNYKQKKHKRHFWYKTNLKKPHSGSQASYAQNPNISAGLEKNILRRKGRPQL